MKITQPRGFCRMKECSSISEHFLTGNKIHLQTLMEDPVLRSPAAQPTLKKMSFSRQGDIKHFTAKQQLTSPQKCQQNTFYWVEHCSETETSGGLLYLLSLLSFIPKKLQKYTQIQNYKCPILNANCYDCMTLWAVMVLIS